MLAASRKRWVWWVGILLLVLAGPMQAEGREGSLPPSPSNGRPAVAIEASLSSFRMARRLLVLVNGARWERGIPPLKAEPMLARAARAHALSMAQEDYFGHRGKDNSTPWERIEAAGYQTWQVLAENIAAGYDTPEKVLAAWLESPPHRSNLLNPELREAGIGYAFQPGDTYPGGNWGYVHYWTMDMGCRWDSYPLVIALEAYSTTTRQVSLYLYGQGWAQEMRLSNDRTNWTAWHPYRSTLTWELAPGNGPKVVYAELRDGRGNVMRSEDDILLQEGPDAPAFHVHPEQVVFTLGPGQHAGQPQRHTFQLQGERGSVAWQASLDQGWLALDVYSGTTPSRLNLTLDDAAGRLPPGLYTATLSFQGGGTRVNVPVRLLVLPRLHVLYLPLLLNRGHP
ncbi:MAG: CAP domain-containing protein [Chloroflexia bacterium]